MPNNKLYSSNDTKSNHRVRFNTPDADERENDTRSKNGEILGNKVPNGSSWNNAPDVSAFPELPLHKIANPPPLEKHPQETVSQIGIFRTSSKDLATPKLDSTVETYSMSIVPANESFTCIVPDVVVRKDTRQQMSQQLQTITTRMFKVKVCSFRLARIVIRHEKLTSRSLSDVKI